MEPSPSCVVVVPDPSHLDSCARYLPTGHASEARHIQPMLTANMHRRIVVNVRMQHGPTPIPHLIEGDR